MTWNFRVHKHTVESALGPETIYDVIEVYYNEDGSIWAYSHPYTLEAYEEFEWIEKDLQHIAEACKLPVLTDEDLPVANEEPPEDEEEL